MLQYLQIQEDVVLRNWPWLKIGLVVAFAGLAVLSGWLLYDRQQANATIQQLQSDLTSANFQLNQAQQAAAATPTPSPSPSPTPVETPKPTATPRTSLHTPTPTPTPVPTRIP